MQETTGFVVWFTGLPSAGKSTLAQGAADQLRALGHARVEVLDGDALREWLSPGLSFERADRAAHLHRVARLAQLLARNGVIVLVAAIAPYQDVRQEVRDFIGKYIEIYVRCPLDELVKRDVKGLYARALRGEIDHFTGVNDPYEEPEHPELILSTDQEAPEESIERVIQRLKDLHYL